MKIRSDSFEHRQRIPPNSRPARPRPTVSVSRPTAIRTWPGTTCRRARSPSRCCASIPTCRPMPNGRQRRRSRSDQPRTRFHPLGDGRHSRRRARDRRRQLQRGRGRRTASRDPSGPAGSRQGLNDYTGWFAATPTWPATGAATTARSRRRNDLRLHRYFFRVFALDVGQARRCPSASPPPTCSHAMHGPRAGRSDDLRHVFAQSRRHRLSAVAGRAEPCSLAAARSGASSYRRPGGYFASTQFRLDHHVQHIRDRRRVGRRILHVELLHPQHVARAGVCV